MFGVTKTLNVNYSKTKIGVKSLTNALGSSKVCSTTTRVLTCATRQSRPLQQCISPPSMLSKSSPSAKANNAFVEPPLVPFNCLIGLCQEDARARFNLVQDLERFVDGGLRDVAVDKPLGSIAGLAHALCAKLAQTLSIVHPSGMSATLARTRAQAVFCAAFTKQARVLRLSVIDINLDQLHASPEEDFSVKGALELAHFNRHRALKRYVATLTLFHANRSQKSASLFEADVCVNVGQACTVLKRKAKDFEFDALRFALLLGGEALEAERQRVAMHLSQKSLSVIGFVSLEGAIPGHRPAQAEATLQADIQACASVPIRAVAYG